MKALSDKAIRKIIAEKELALAENLLDFIAENPLRHSMAELSRIAELANNTRENDGAYYTDDICLKYIETALPNSSKEMIRILEPSVGVGNFIPIIVKHFSKSTQIMLDVCDINANSLAICEALNRKRNIPNNVQINYIQGDFLELEFEEKYDYVIGNPPFIRLSNKQGLNSLRQRFDDNNAKNMAAFFLEKSVSITNYVVLVMPKVFLSNTDYDTCRNIIASYGIDTIIDFGENGFKGVLIETIAIFINTNSAPGMTQCKSISRKTTDTITQDMLTDPTFPNWLLYRNNRFNKIASGLEFNIFNVVRDRQITNKLLENNGDIWVIKSRNVNLDGTGISQIDGYDSYIDSTVLETISVGKYFGRTDVFLSPNMTYYPRVVRKPKDVIVNGSVAILISKGDPAIISTEDLLYYSSDEFREFYAIARNFSTRTLNIDKNSVFYFGRKRSIQ
jgi:DNA (cytosine-5)-methyltransferase 1